MSLTAAMEVAQHALHQQLQSAVTKGDLDTTRAIIETDPCLVNLALTRNTPILVIAVEKVRHAHSLVMRCQEAGNGGLRP